MSSRFAFRILVKRAGQLWAVDFTLLWVGWGGRTPDEVHFGRRKRLRPLGRIDYFDGARHWWRFG